MSITVKSISPSSVTSYLMCPEKFFLDKIDRAPRKGVSAAMLFGIGIHAAAEAFYRAAMLRHDLNADQLMRVFASEWEGHDEADIVYSASKERADLFATAKSLIDLLIITPLPGKVIAIERPIRFALTNSLDVVGRLDLVLRLDNGKLCVVDLKTSARAYGDDELRNVAEQTWLYSCAFDEHDILLAVRVLLKKKVPEIVDINLPTDLVNHDEIVNRYMGVKAAIEAGIRYRIRGWACKTCCYNYLCDAKSCAEPVYKVAA